MELLATLLGLILYIGIIVLFTYIGYRVLKAAIREGIKESGLVDAVKNRAE